MNAFAPQRITRETELIINAPPQRVFPLLCPVREYEWIEPWRCRLIYTDSGFAENNCVFQTDFPVSGGNEICVGPETWVVSHYKKDCVIEFVRFTPEEKIIKLDIHLSATAEGATRLVWRKVFTGLSPEGNRVIATMSDDFEAEAESISLMLNHYLETGNMRSAANLSAGTPSCRKGN